MDDILAPLFNLFPAMWERRWWGLAVAWGVAVLGALGVLHYKERYLASATVYVDTQTTLRPLLEGLAVQPDVGQQAAMLARTLLSRKNVEAVIDRNHLLAPGSSDFKRELLIQRLTQTIGLKINGRDNIYAVSYVGTDPQQTLGVVRTLLNLFVQSGLTGNRQDSTQALQFIDSQIALYRSKLADADAKLASFRAQHPQVASQGAAGLAASQQQLQSQQMLVQGQLAAAVSARAALQAQLANVPATSPRSVAGPAAEPGSSDLDVRIAAQRRRLDDLLQRYTDAYPDVVTARAELARLQAQRQREAESGVGATAPSAQPVQANNPVYQQLKVSLAQSDANVAALQSQLADLRSQMQSLSRQQSASGGLDEQYAQLLRERSLLDDNYQKLVQRREAATLSRNQDLSRRGEEFRVVDPPRLAPQALFPRRTFLIALVLVLAVGLGALASYAMVIVFPTYRTARQLRETTQRAVLGTVSWVLTPETVVRERWQLGWFMVSSAVLVLIFVAWTLASMLHWIH
ncbi:XrtA system polysaccharide chain length determinant [Thiomonas sp. FB-6]|uniref:XrtA system polysaccharide chain length determinant n=1 Tax=Thiomonas sp. FB-6 TaxID=1158291 RepID=UPI000379AFC2|nr:XrtA system polysaccharide chain length determinant [Thiomonas sp. FB-6]